MSIQSKAADSFGGKNELSSTAKNVLFGIVLTILVPVCAFVHILVSETCFSKGGIMVWLPFVSCFVTPGAILMAIIYAKNVLGKALMGIVFSPISLFLNVLALFAASWLTG